MLMIAPIIRHRFYIKPNQMQGRECKELKRATEIIRKAAESEA